MRTGRAVESVAYSSELILRADQLQYELGEGPCLDAVWTDGVFVIPDLRADGRWPRWAPAAAGLGVGSSVSVHLFTDTALGSLNLYSLHPRDYAHADLEAAKVIGAHASVVLAYTRTEQNLWQAIDTRNLIGQAQGMLMQKYGLTAEKAFGVLRRYSQQHNLKLAAVAEQLTTTRALPAWPPRTRRPGSFLNRRRSPTGGRSGACGGWGYWLEPTRRSWAAIRRFATSWAISSTVRLVA